jgi:hypothetical protein
MHWQRVAVILTLLNFVILAVNLFDMRAAAQSVPPVLRGRALEIVDDHNRVRAEIRVLPADPTIKMPDGTVGYPETVLLRLLDTKNGPHVKLSALEDGAGLTLGGATGRAGYLQFLSRTDDPFIKLVGNDGHERLFKP